MIERILPPRSPPPTRSVTRSPKKACCSQKNRRSSRGRRRADAGNSSPHACARGWRSPAGRAVRSSGARIARRISVAGRGGRQHHALPRIPRGRGCPERTSGIARYRRRAPRGAAGTPECWTSSPATRSGAGWTISLRRCRPSAGSSCSSAPRSSVYKAWFPLTGRWLDFESADIVFDLEAGDPQPGTFSARLLVEGPLARFDGRWLAAQGLLVTAVVVPA
jgi:hypothetical protein